MRKIYVHPDLLRVLTLMVENNEERRTKVARTLIEATNEGLDENVFIKDMSNYWSFAEDTKKMISYVRKDKLTKKIAELKSIAEGDVTNEMLVEFDESFFTKKVTRTRCKSGKIITRLFNEAWRTENFTNQDVEWFTNQYSAAVRDELDFKLVKGEDIRKYYLVDNYDEDAPQGTLRGSCMGPQARQKFLDLYVNSENVSMLVAFSDNKKVIGRAIVWDNVSFKERDSVQEVHKGQFMDRIYHSYDWITDKFKSWAKERGIFVKNNQSHDDYYNFINPETNNIEQYYIEVEVEMRHRYLPYLDTMHIPNYKRGYITNKTDGYDTSTQMRAHDTGTPSHVWDSVEGKIVRSGHSSWGEDIKTWIHRDDCVIVLDDNFHKKLCIKDRLNGYITPKDEKIKCVVTGDDFAKRNMVESEHHQGFIHKDESVETVDAGIVHKDESVESKYLGSRLSKSGSIHLTKLDDYLPKTVLDNGLDVESFEKVMETLNELKGETNFSDSSTFVFEF